MQLFKHAYFSLKYSKLQWLSKILLLFLYFNLMFSLFDSINGFKKEIKASKERYGTQVQIISISGMMSTLTYQQLEEYGKSDYVDHTEKYGYLYLESQEEQSTVETQEKMVSSVGSMIGVLQKNDLKDRVKTSEPGATELKSGECLISQQYAEMKQINRGDTLSFINGQSQVDFTVKDIFESAKTDSFAADIYTTAELLETQDSALYKRVEWDATYYLRDAVMIDDFSDELRNKGIPDDFMVLSNEKYYKEETVFLNEAMERAVYLLFGVALIGVVLLYILTTLSRKKQQTEIGFLYSMGISRAKMAMLFVGNNLLLVLVTGLLSVFSISGYLTSFAQFLLNTTQKMFETQTTEIFSMTSFSIVTSGTAPITAVSIQPSLSYEKILLVGIVLIILSMDAVNKVRRFQLSSHLMEEIR